MDVESLAKQLILQNMTPEQQKAVLDSVRSTLLDARGKQKQRVSENVGAVVDALKKIEADIRAKYDDLGNKITTRVNSIRDGRDGTNGSDGRDGLDGRPGRDGAQGPAGPAGRDGVNGVDGVDGVSVTDAKIDFDGSLIISLSNGREINVGEVVTPDVAEKIRVVANGGGTSQTVIDTLASLQAQIDALGDLVYDGTWDASTNTPALASSVGNSGHYYVVSVAGNTNLNGVTDWNVGDWAIFNGTFWQKIDQTNLVLSVNGQTGAVNLTTTDIAEGTNLYYTDTRARASVSAGSGITYDSATGVVTNAAPDQTVALTGSTGISTSGTYPNFTITNTLPDQTVVLTAGTGISTSGTYPNFTITNTSPSLGGDVVGPSSATDNAVARYDATTGKLIQNSLVLIGDTGSVTGVDALTAESLTVNNNATLGSSNTDTLDVRSRISSDLDPESNNAKDIGSSGRNWRDGFFGRNLSTVNLEVTGTTSFDGSQGTSGQVLTSAGTGATPTWTTPTTGTVTSVSGTGTVNGISLSGTVTSSGNLTLGGALSGVDLATQVTGTLPIANGGTGQTTAVAAFDALAPTTTKGDLIVSNGSDNVRLPVGTNNFVLVADSAEATGVKWSAGGSGMADPGANGIVVRTALNTTTARTITAGTGISVSNGDGTAGNPTVTNSGVTSLAGTTNQVTVSASTGSITVSLPTAINVNLNGSVGATTPNTGAFTTLSATGVTTVQAGTVSNPAITTSGDTNTGIYFPAADQVAISTGGSERLLVDDSGNAKLSTAGTKILNSSGRAILNQTGSVLQVVQNSTVGSSSTTSTSFVDVTNLTVTITPSSTSSTILVVASGRISNTIVAATNPLYLQRLLRGGTELLQRLISADSGGGGLQAKGSLAVTYYDSPATTSATTYKIQHRSSTASSTGTCDEAWIIVMEIAG